MSLNGMEPCSDVAEHYINAAHGFYLAGIGFHVQHRRQVAMMKLGIGNEVACLRGATAFCREEVICSHGNSLLACLTVVLMIERVADGFSLGRFDKHEIYRIV